MNDAELIAHITSGEDRLFGELVRRHERCVWAICASYIRNPSDCEDVAREVLVRGYLRLDTLRDRAAFGPWLAQVARRTCLDWLRAASSRQATRERYSDHLGRTPASGATTEAGAVAKRTTYGRKLLLERLGTEVAPAMAASRPAHHSRRPTCREMARRSLPGRRAGVACAMRAAFRYVPPHTNWNP